MARLLGNLQGTMAVAWSPPPSPSDPLGQPAVAVGAAAGEGAVAIVAVVVVVVVAAVVEEVVVIQVVQVVVAVIAEVEVVQWPRCGGGGHTSAILYFAMR